MARLLHLSPSRDNNPTAGSVDGGALAGGVVGKSLPEMSYGYHEVKLYLSTAKFEISECQVASASRMPSCWAMKRSAWSARMPDSIWVRSVSG